MLNNKLPKLILTDIDGVWTDGGMYYDQNSNEFKKFNTSDSAGVLLCKYFNVPVGIVTGEKTEIVSRRAKKLGIDYLFMGVENKVEIVQKLLTKLNISFDDVAYVGDDINDIGLLNKCAITATPLNSPDYVRRFGKLKLEKKGGDGAFREFVEKVFGEIRINQFVKNYLN